MLDKLNPFKRQPQNPLERLSEDELLTEQKLREHDRNNITKQIRELEARKARLFDEGMRDPNQRLERAHDFKEADEQIQLLRQQLHMSNKLLRIFNRLLFLKRNEKFNRTTLPAILRQTDSSAILSHLQRQGVTVEVSYEQLDQLEKALDDLLGSYGISEKDPEIDRLMEEMERAASTSIPAPTTLSEPARHESPAAESPQM